jgi:hypothetical protein
MTFMLKGKGNTDIEIIPELNQDQCQTKSTGKKWSIFQRNFSSTIQICLSIELSG